MIEKQIHEVPKGSLKLTIGVPAVIILAMWAVFIAEWKGGFNWHFLGVYPREPQGMLGIFTAPFVHADWKHLINNSLPMLLLGASVFYFYKEVAFKILVYSFLITGLWVWVGARPSWHIGASGVVYALAAFLFTSGVIRKNKHLLTVSLIVVFLYGSMIWGVLPIEHNVSWESHLFGGIAGVILAYFFRKEGPQRKVILVEEEEDDDLDDENPYWLVDENGHSPHLQPEAKPIQIRYIYRAKNQSSDQNMVPTEKKDK